MFLNINQNVKDFLVEEGYDIQFGARPLKRAIQSHLEDGLAELIVNEKAESGDLIVADLNKDTRKIEFTVKKQNEIMTE